MKATDEYGAIPDTGQGNVVLTMDVQIRISLARFGKLQATNEDVGPRIYRTSDELGTKQYRQRTDFPQQAW